MNASNISKTFALSGPMITALLGAVSTDNPVPGQLLFGTDGMVRSALIRRGLVRRGDRKTLTAPGADIANILNAAHGTPVAATGYQQVAA